MARIGNIMVGFDLKKLGKAIAEEIQTVGYRKPVLIKFSTQELEKIAEFQKDCAKGELPHHSFESALRHSINNNSTGRVHYFLGIILRGKLFCESYIVSESNFRKSK